MAWVVMRVNVDLCDFSVAGERDCLDEIRNSRWEAEAGERSFWVLAH